MTSRTNPWQDWPALAGWVGHPLPPLRCERAVWGREPGAGAGPHWLATSAGFGGSAEGIERSLAFGDEDVPWVTLAWRSSGSLHYAVRCYPSRAPAGGRPGLEKQLIEWRRPQDLPAALGALVLLPQAERLDDTIWWGKSGDDGDFADGFHLALAPDETTEIPFDEIDLQTTILAGCRELAEATDPPALAALYTRLLAGAKGIALPGLTGPLSGAALAALLLPLARERADRLGLVAWLPSRRLRPGQTVHPWDLILGGAPTDTASVRAAAADETQVSAAERMAAAVLAGDPRRLQTRPTTRPSPATPKAPPTTTPETRRLVLWGLAAAGKTAYLAQLYLQLEHATDSEWRVYPGPDSLGFFRALRARLQTQNRFPAPTPVDKASPVRCRLVHGGTGAEAMIEVEDRAGEDFRLQTDAVYQQLATADGLILLFDPLLEVALQREAFKDALDRMSVAETREGGRDTRPVAFCLAKADAFITTAAHYRSALEDPDAFVRARVEHDILQSLEHHFATYRLFPVSAAGVWVEHGAVTPAVFFDEDLNPRLSSQSHPLHLLDPLTWVLKRLEAATPGAETS
ncbi:TRAFAC clade GTPase domain-containing protein [Lamprocystis purpurea]|jgi:hypothetical protein|uniref:TRAFAC clade GTPase domain-containing protein n=1 Tax=Lamprocystis purpurea TaxID=61598 RepID=UPI00036F0BE1|nr:hypothetical protein [Lamprocystis purpurea]